MAQAAERNRTTNPAASPEVQDSASRSLYRVGGTAAWIVGLLIFVDIPIFFIWPPPGNLQPTRATVVAFFTLFHQRRLVGLLDLDLLGLVAYVFLVPVLLALFQALRKSSPAFLPIATVFALVGIGIYFAANPAFAMLSLSSQYAVAATDVQRSLLEASGETLLTTFYVTVFGMSYIMIAASLLIISAVALRSQVFSKATAGMGIVANSMMLIGGLLFPWPLLGALLSLLGAVALGVWAIQTGRTLRRLAAAPASLGDP